MSKEAAFEHKYKNWGKQVYNTLQWLSLDLVKIIVEYGRELRLIQTFKLVLQVDKDSLIRVQSDGDMVIFHKTKLYVFNPLSVLQPIQFAHVISIYDKFGSLDALLDLHLVNIGHVNDVCLDLNGRVYVLILNEIRVYDFY